MKLFFIFSIIFCCFVIQNLGLSDPTTSEPATTSSGATETTHFSTSESSDSSTLSGSLATANTDSSGHPTAETNTGTQATDNPVENTTPISQEETTAAQNIPTTQADTWADFDLDCNTTADYCIYTINAPQLSADAYNSENSKYQTDKNEYLAASSKAYYDSASFYASAVYQSYKDAKDKFENITLQMESLSEIVNQAFEDSQNQTASIQQSLNDIKIIYSKLSNCYYRKCALATVPPTTTTTTQRTKPPDACASQTCEAPLPYGNGNCSLLFNGTPTCQCPGNLDQKNGCGSVGCNLLKDGLKDGTVPGPFWSPGYDRENGGTYKGNLNCQYKISSNKKIKVTVNKFKFDPTLNLTINNRVVPKSISEVAQLQQIVNAYVGSSKVITVSIVTGDVVSSDKYFIDWDLTN